MSNQPSTTKHPFWEEIVEKLSPQNSSLDSLFAKLGVSYTGLLAGITLSDLFTLASLIYVLLNIYVLVRDKIMSKKKQTVDSQLSGE